MKWNYLILAVPLVSGIALAGDSGEQRIYSRFAGTPVFQGVKKNADGCAGTGDRKELAVNDEVVWKSVDDKCDGWHKGQVQGKAVYLKGADFSDVQVDPAEYAFRAAELDPNADTSSTNAAKGLTEFQIKYAEDAKLADKKAILGQILAMEQLAQGVKTDDIQRFAASHQLTTMAVRKSPAVSVSPVESGQVGEPATPPATEGGDHE